MSVSFFLLVRHLLIPTSLIYFLANNTNNKASIKAEIFLIVVMMAIELLVYLLRLGAESLTSLFNLVVFEFYFVYLKPIRFYKNELSQIVHMD